MNEERNEQRRYVDPVIEAYKPGVDVTLLVENLKLTPQERILRMAEHLRSAAEFRQAVLDSTPR